MIDILKELQIKIPVSFLCKYFWSESEWLLFLDKKREWDEVC